METATQVVFVVPPQVHLLDLTGPVQVFYEAGTYGVAYQLIYCTYHSDLTSSAGLSFANVLSFEQVITQRGDLLVLPGLEMEYIRSQSFKREGAVFFAWLREQYARGVHLCSVCTGAFLLAQAGLLDSRKCTTHWRRLDELQQTFPRVLAQPDRLFVKDGGIYSSAGVTAGIDLALYLLEERHGPRFATQVARELVVYLRRGAMQGQQSVYLDCRNHLNSAIHRVQDWLSTHLSVAATLEELAEIAHMSSRNLTRTFRRETGITIGDYLTRLRLELAHTLAHRPGMTQEAIAKQCGFQDARQLRRLRQKANATESFIRTHIIT